MAAFFAGWAAGVGPEHAEQFFDNSFLAITLLLAAASGISGGGAAAYAILRRAERSLLVILTLAWGLFVLAFTIGELLLDENPGRGPAAGGNGHFNMSASNAGPGQVRVSFDYTYQVDPPGVTVTGITITPLNDTGREIDEYDAVRVDVLRGTHHVDLLLDILPEQEQELRAFSVCFTGRGEPDLGCRTVDYDRD
ncbi:MAG: hypothetical protein AB7I38_03945 [Dehalococcoidia bacterium]